MLYIVSVISASHLCLPCVIESIVGRLGESIMRRAIYRVHQKVIESVELVNLLNSSLSCRVIESGELSSMSN